VAQLYRSPLFSGCASFCTAANALDRVSSVSALHDTLDVVYRARVCGRNPARVFSCAKDSGSRIERRALYQALRMFALAAAASHRPFSLLEATFNLTLNVLSFCKSRTIAKLFICALRFSQFRENFRKKAAGNDETNVNGEEVNRLKCVITVRNILIFLTDFMSTGMFNLPP